MKNKTKARTPKQGSLFFKYCRITLSIVIVTVVLVAFVFLAFVANYWTADSVNVLRRNTENVVATAETLIASGKMESDRAESSLVLCNSLNMVSNAISADVFMTDANGEIVLCKDLLNSSMEVINRGECDVHQHYKVPYSILKKTTTAGGYYTMDTLKGLYDKLSIVVGYPVEYEGNTIAYIFAVASVPEGLGPYIFGVIKMFIGAAVISLVFALILIYVFSYGMTKPLEEMSAITKSYAKGDFSKRIKTNPGKKKKNELDDLAEALNGMAESLSVLEDSRRSFVANISHELKTPMTSIGGFIDGILDGTIPPDEGKHYLKIVSKEVRRLSNLVVTMLTLSKIEACEEKLKFAETDLKNLVFNALLSFESYIEQANISIEGFENMPAVSVMADEGMIYQVAYNLFDNAVKFTNEFGTIYVEISDEPDRATVTISNTGEGIPEEELKRIFERFYKVDKSRSEHVKGVGLGLSLVKNIVSLHGGDVSVTSEPGKLTTFSFWLPKKQERS